MRRRFRRSRGEEAVPPEPAATSFDDVLARQLEPAAVDELEPIEDQAIDAPDPIDEHQAIDGPEPVDEAPVGPVVPGDFWDRYDRARAEADLAEVPPAAVVAVVGPLEAARPVIRRCRRRHWMGRCDVFVLTNRPAVSDEPDWRVVGQPSDLVAALEEGGSDFPLLVLDVPSDLPAFVRPLVARLRERGVGLVHYVLDDDPADEDLATWHGELGQPSVLDLAGPVASARVLELVDRGEPVVSVAGCDLTTELLLALRIEEAAAI